jgi:predicted TIM-barrel fold metal-dependent hydrolase
VIFDSLTFYGPCLHGWAVSERDLLAALDASDAARAIAVAPKPPEYRFEPANDAVAELARAHPDRVTGLVRVDPWRPDAAGEAERGLGELQLAGVFLHPWQECFRVNMPEVDAVVAVAAGHGVPVVIAAGFPWVSEALQAADLARRFPETPFVLTTGGQINISGLGQIDAELAVEQNGNVYLQTSGVYREDFITGVAARCGADRLLYASGFPQFEPRLERRRVEWAAELGEHDRRVIMWDNAARLFGAS